MTREEAIKVLDKELVAALWINHRSEKAVREAVEALKAPEERTDKRTETHACDLIDRQAVLALPRNIERNMSGEVVEETIHVAHVKRIPSVDAVPVVRCGECKHMTATGWCSEFADDCIRPSSSDFCSRGERKDGAKMEDSDG